MVFTRADLGRLAALAIAICATGCGDIESLGSPESCFKATFGVKPPPTVFNLSGQGKSFRDGAHAYLKFNASFETVTGLIGSNFQPMTQTEFARDTGGAALVGPTPPWWTPLQGSRSIFLKSTSFHRSFHQGKAYVSIDVPTQTAHVYWMGFD